MIYSSPYGRPRRRFSLVIPALAVLVAIGIAAVLFLPTYLTKRSLDNLIATLPAGTTLTYAGVTYGLFSDTVELRQVAYTQPGPDNTPLKITAAALSFTGGNMHLDQAAATAQQPGAQPSLTRVASKIVLKDENTQFGPVTAHADQITLANLQFDFATFYAPLAPLEPDSTPMASALPGAQAALQKIARDVASVAYDHLDVQNLSLTAKDPHGPTSITVKLAALSSEAMSRGDYTSIMSQGLDVQSGLFRLTVDNITTGPTSNAPFWQALLAGQQLETALTHFQGAPQTLQGLHIFNAATEMASLAMFTVGNLSYDQGQVTSLDISLEKLQLNLPAMPFPGIQLIQSLGYQTLLIDSTLSYRFDPATHLSHFENTTLTLNEGGKLSLDGTFQQPLAGAVATSFVPVTPKLVGITLRYDDAGLFDRVLDQQAKASHQSADAVRQGWLALLEQQRQGMQADPVTGAAISEGEKFIANPQSLTLTLTPPAPVGVADLDQSHPELFATELGLQLKAD
jgi:hypothetical protein